MSSDQDKQLKRWVSKMFAHLSKKYNVPEEKLGELVADWEDLKEDMLAYTCPNCGEQVRGEGLRERLN